MTIDSPTAVQSTTAIVDPDARGRVVFSGPDGVDYYWMSPQTKAEFHWMARQLFDIVFAPTPHPDCVARGHSAPLDVAWDAYTAASPIIVLVGSRGLAGKSTLEATVSTFELLDSYSIVILGGALAQSKRVHEVASDIFESDVVIQGPCADCGGQDWEHLVSEGYRAEVDETVFEYRNHEWNGEAQTIPQGLRHLIVDPTVQELRAAFGRNKMLATPAGPKSTRSRHPERLRLDEVDEMSMVDFDAAMGQTMTKDPVNRPAQTLAASTHQHPNGTFTEVKERAVARGWPIHEVCYRENLIENGGWLYGTEVKRKKLEVSDLMWNVEFELQEPSPEGRAIGAESVVLAFDPRYGEYEGHDAEYLEFPCCPVYVRARQRRLEDPDEQPPPTPCQSHVYATGADWGQHRDMTVITTYRVDTGGAWWMVAFERINDSEGKLGRGFWPLVLGKLETRIRRFPGKSGHDATGLGQGLNGFLSEKVRAFTLSPTVRDPMLAAYVVGMEHGELIGPRVKWAYRGHLYTTNDDLKSGQAGHVHDSVVAGAIAWKVGGGVKTLLGGLRLGELDRDEGTLDGLDMVE